jgi:hypothetical protein
MSQVKERAIFGPQRPVIRRTFTIRFHGGKVQCAVMRHVPNEVHMLPSTSRLFGHAASTFPCQDAPRCGSPSTIRGLIYVLEGTRFRSPDLARCQQVTRMETW